MLGLFRPHHSSQIKKPRLVICPTPLLYLPFVRKSSIGPEVREPWPKGAMPTVGTWEHHVDSNSIIDLVFDSARNQMVAATYGGVVFWDPETHQYHVETKDSGLASNFVYAVDIDAEGNYWFGTSAGVSRRSSDGRWSTFTTEDGLLSDQIFDLLIDQNETRWFVTRQGVMSQPAGEWRAPEMPAGLSDVVVSIAEDTRDGSIWFAHGDHAEGLTQRTSDGKLVRFGRSDGLELPSAKLVEVDGSGRVWAQTYRESTEVTGFEEDEGLFVRDAGGQWSRIPVQDGFMSVEGDENLSEVSFLSSFSGGEIDPNNGLRSTMVWLSEACDASEISDQVQGRIAIAVLGACQPKQKVETAQALGAAALVLVPVHHLDNPFNTVDGRYRLSLEASVTMPVVMVDANAGSLVRTALSSSTGLEASLHLQPR